MNSTSPFELVFEGPIDESAETLRRLKAALLVDLGLPIERAQEILQSAPIVIASSLHKEELLRTLTVLKNAGGRALLITPTEELHEPSPGEEHEIEIEIDIDGDGEIGLKTPHHRPEPKTYQLSMDDDESEPLFPPALLTGQSPDGPEPETEPNQMLGLSAGAPEEEDDAPLFDPSLLKKAAAEAARIAEEASTFSLSFDDDAPPTARPPAPAAPPQPQSPVSLSFDDDTETTSPSAPTVISAPSTSTRAAPEQPSSPLAFSTDEGLDLTIGPAEPEAEYLSREENSNLNSLLESVSLDEVEPEEDVDLTLKPEDVPTTPQKVSTLQMKEEAPPPPKLADAKAIQPPPPETKSSPVREVPPPQSQAPSLEDQGREPDKVAAQRETYEISSSPAPTSGPTRKKKKVPWDIALGVIVGGALLAAGNWLYFSSQEPEVRVPDISMIAAATKPKTKTESVKEDAKPKAMNLAGEQSDPNQKLTVQIEAQPDGGIMVILQGETPAPPPLTVEQIGRRESLPPWLRKIEIDRVRLAVNTEGTFEQKLPVKMYVEYLGETERLIGSASITGMVSKDRTLATLSIAATYGSPEGERSPFLAHHSDGTWGVRFSGEVTLRAKNGG